MKKRMWTTLLLVGLVPLLSACEGTIYALKNAEATSSRKIKQLSDKYNPQPEIIRRPAQSGYCYAVRGDTVCYRDPIPNAENRLVGYQEPLVSVTSPQEMYIDQSPKVSQPQVVTSETLRPLDVSPPPPVADTNAGPVLPADIQEGPRKL